MWMFCTIVLVYSLTVYGEEECEPRKYGDACNFDCPKNCHTFENISFYCNKDDGKCSEGCSVGFYGDICTQACSTNCKCHTCNQHNGHCTSGCIENHIGDFCENTKGTTDGSHTTETTSVAPTIKSSSEKVHIKVIIPVVVIIVLVLAGSVCTVIIVLRCRKRKEPDPEGQELLPNNSNGNQVEREDSDLHIACKRGQLEEVKHVLSNSISNINSRGLYGWTPLMAAARYGQRGVFDFLVSKGCDQVMFDDSGNNILHVACLGGDLKLVKSILSKDTVGINSRGHFGRTPIMGAARMGHKHVFKNLLSMECNASLVDDDSNNILHYACIGGHLEVVQCILDTNILDINSKGKEGLTPVMISVEAGHKQVFDVLVQKDADLSQVDDNGNSILHVACIGGQVEMVKHILAQDLVDIDSKSHDGRTSVMAAVEHGHRDIFELLVSKGADLSLVDTHGNNILHVMCSKGNMNMVKYLLTKDSVDINSKGENGRTPLMWATWRQQSEVIDTLVSKGADASLVDDDGNNILHYACIQGRMAVVESILNKKIVDINSKGKEGMTPVIISAEAGHTDVFHFLVQNGADPSQVADNGNNIFYVACIGGHLEMVKHILSKDLVDINSKGQAGRTSVMAAAEPRCREVFELLVSKGADLSLADNNGDNILHSTCSGGDMNMVKYLLTKDSVDINSRGQNGRTPLMWATWRQQSEVIDFLVSKGADTSLVDDDGNNILHYACIQGHMAVVESFLNKKIVDINSKGKEGMTPVMISAEAGHVHVFDFLVYKGAGLSQVADNGNTILHLGCVSGCVAIVKYVLSKGIIDINSKGQLKRTPLMMAAQAGHRDVFILLVSEGADVSLVDEHNDNILHLTCRVGHLDMVKFVLSQGIVDIDSTGQHNRTPVMMAAATGHEEVYNVLVNEEANLSNSDASGNNILHLGCLGGSEGVVQHILSQNVVDIKAINNDGSKAETIVTGKDHGSICELLMSQPTN